MTIPGCRPRLRVASSVAMMLLICAADGRGNPLFEAADPHAVVIDGRFWIFPTEARSREPLFAAYDSEDLRHWKRHGPVLRLSDVPWITDDGQQRHHAWAPCVAVADATMYFYYSVGPQQVTPSRIGVATGPAPAGPFRDSGRPLVTGDDSFEAIDPMVFTAADGTSYLYAGGSAGRRLRAWQLGADMVSLATELPIETPPRFTEAAFLHERAGLFYLSYSHGAWNDAGYSVHYATGPSPTGPWNYRGEILASDATHKGPGHHSFIETPAGDWLIVYHRWETTAPRGPYRGRRRIAIDRVTYRADGTIEPIRMTDGHGP